MSLLRLPDLGQLRRSLLPPAPDKLSQDSNDPVVRRPTTPRNAVCSICMSKDLPALFTWRRDDAVWPLAELNHQSCAFCSLLVYIVLADHGTDEYLGFLKRKATLRLVCCGLWEWKYRDGLIGRRVDILLPDGSPPTAQDCCHYEPEDGSCILRLSPVTSFHGLVSKDPGTSLNLKPIAGWIEKCQNYHACWRPTTSNQVPKLVIDVKNGSIVVPASIKGFRYLSLSYVWGRVDQPMLTKAKLKLWMKKGALFRLKLPQTIKDAMVLTADIGERYLWVDCLCIVQDDAADLHSQINMMHVIYRQSFLTIIAAAGENSNAGLPGVRHSTAKREQRPTAVLENLHLSTVRIKPHRELRKSFWNTRGWTCQEELCASRRLVFTKSSLVVFNCGETSWREEFPDRLGVNNRERYLYPLYPMDREAKDENESEDTLSWFSVVLQHYLMRDLTSDDDILRAISGVTSLVSKRLGNSFWGLGEKYFHECICWSTSGSGQVPGRRRAGFPSWSWAGWHHPKYRLAQPIFKYAPRENGLAPMPTIKFFSTRKGPWPKHIGQTHAHFEPREPDIRSALALADKGLQSQIVSFNTSRATLQASSLHDEHGAAVEHLFGVRGGRGADSPLVATMWLDRPAQDEPFAADFIVVGRFPRRSALWDSLVAHDVLGNGRRPLREQDEVDALDRRAKQEESFVLMMVERERGVAFRRAIAGNVPASVWWDDVKPEGELVVLG
jgi:hypothetical protein